MTQPTRGTQGTRHLLVEGLAVELTRKRVRNINLRVRDDGSVCVSAPARVPQERIEAFVSSRRAWIEQARQRARARALRYACECEDGATISLWGEPLVCHVIGTDDLAGQRCRIAQENGELLVCVHPKLAGTDEDATAWRSRALRAWLREQLLARIAQLLTSCEEVVGKRCSGVRLRTMSSRWGSCNVQTGRITISTRLVHCDQDCLEYVLYHELCHLHEPSHNARFHALMDRYYPTWPEVRARLNE